MADWSCTEMKKFLVFKKAYEDHYRNLIKSHDRETAVNLCVGGGNFE